MSLMTEYLKPHAHLDGIDEIVSAMTERAHSIPATLEGLVEMLAHPAAFEEGAFEHVVVHPPLLERVASEHDVVPTLLAWTAEQEAGRAQRGLYALVRVLGADSTQARDGLASGHGPSEIAVLCALSDLRSDGARPSEPIEGDAAEAVRRLIREGVHAEGGSAWGDSDRVRPLDEDPRLAAVPLVACGLRLPDPDAAILDVLANPWLREEGRQLLREAGADVSGALRGALRHDVETIREGSPKSTNAMSRIAGSASAMGRDGAGASLVASVFPAIVERYAPVYRPFPDGNDQKRLKDELDAVLAFLLRSMPTIDEPGVTQLASALKGEFTPAFDVAAGAWAHLPPDAAEDLARCFEEGQAELRAARLNAAGRAIAGLATARPELGPILLQHVDAKTLSDDLRQALAHLPLDAAHLEAFVSKAQKADELRLALQVAVDQRASGVLRTALLKLREGPFRIDSAMESAIAKLIDDDNEIWVEAEIDDENPFADRRAALQRALEQRG